MFERDCMFGNWPTWERLPMYALVLVDMVNSDLIDWGGGIMPRAGVTHLSVPPASYAGGDWTPETRVEVVTAGHSGAGPGLQVIVRCTDEVVWPTRQGIQ